MTYTKQKGISKSEFEIIDKLNDKYFLESRNPLIRFSLRFLGKPVTKSESKLDDIKRILYGEN